MVECAKIYVVSFLDPALGLQFVIAGSCRIEGEHLVFLSEGGKLAGLFLLKKVKQWSIMDTVSD
jgi:hypothetical protein